MFSLPTWISSNCQTSLKFSEKQVQNFNKFFLKFTQIVFTTWPRFFKNFFKYFQNFHEVFPNIPQNFFKISTNITQNKYFFIIFAIFSRQFLCPILTFYQVFCKFLNFFFNILLSLSIKLLLKFLVYLKTLLQVSKKFLNLFWHSNYFSYNCQ